MKKFIYWSGIYNAVLGMFLIFPPVYHSVGLNLCSPILGWLIAGFLNFTGVVLILCSRQLRQRASLVYWEAVLRYFAALLLIPSAIFSDIGLIALPLGVVDLFIGLAYTFGLSNELKLSHRDLFFDRVNNSTLSTHQI